MKFDLLTIIAVAAIFGAAWTSAATAQQPQKPVDATEAFFKKGEIPRLEFTLTDEELGKLKADPRTYVKATMVENKKTTYADVAIKLKGAAGSFREWDDKPALTVNVKKFTKGQKFHDLEKFHLQNSVQDDTYMHEWVCSELFAMAGYPAVRITHARVILNQRDVGFYALKESFDENFIKRKFPAASGNLYDGGFCQEIDAELEKDEGKGPDDRSDLRALFAACQEKDRDLRWKRLDELCDIKAAITFVAMELMLAHWDGYSLNRNNYRLYFEPEKGKAIFIPHGMDQVFGDAGASILDAPNGIVVATIMKNPEWRKAYRKRIVELLPNFNAEKLGKKVDEVHARIRPVLEAMDPQFAGDHAQRIKDLKNRLRDREKNLLEQSKQPEPKPLVIARNGFLRLTNWRRVSECEDAILEEKSRPGEKVLTIQTGKSGVCVASWRKTVFLAKGRYRFSAILTTKDVADLDDSPNNSAGLRISGVDRQEKFTGSIVRKPVDFTFEIGDDPQNIELILELKAKKGQVSFPLENLKLARVGD